MWLSPDSRFHAQGAAGDIFTGLTVTTDARSLVYNLVTEAPETSSLFKIDLAEDGPSAPVMLSLPDQYVVLFDPLP